MSLLDEIAQLTQAFAQAQLHYAVIGGIAMGLHGVQRATFDLDFILLLEDLDRAHTLLLDAGFTREFHSANVSHYLRPAASLQRVDILHAFREPSRNMLARAQFLPLVAAPHAPQVSLPVVSLEDLIGLKVQALTNDPRRALGDWSDIHRLVTHAGTTRQPLHWPLIHDYLQLFKVDHAMPGLRRLYTAPHGE